MSLACIASSSNESSQGWTHDSSYTLLPSVYSSFPEGDESDDWRSPRRHADVACSTPEQVEGNPSIGLEGYTLLGVQEDSSSLIQLPRPSEALPEHQLHRTTMSREVADATVSKLQDDKQNLTVQLQQAQLLIEARGSERDVRFQQLLKMTKDKELSDAEAKEYMSKWQNVCKVQKESMIEHRQILKEEREKRTALAGQLRAEYEAIIREANDQRAKVEQLKAEEKMLAQQEGKKFRELVEHLKATKMKLTEERDQQRALAVQRATDVRELMLRLQKAEKELHDARLALSHQKTDGQKLTQEVARLKEEAEARSTGYHESERVIEKLRCDVEQKSIEGEKLTQDVSDLRKAMSQKSVLEQELHQDNARLKGTVEQKEMKERELARQLEEMSHAKQLLDINVQKSEAKLRRVERTAKNLRQSKKEKEEEYKENKEILHWELETAKEELQAQHRKNVEDHWIRIKSIEDAMEAMSRNEAELKNDLQVCREKLALAEQKVEDLQGTRERQGRGIEEEEQSEGHTDFSDEETSEEEQHLDEIEEQKGEEEEKGQDAVLERPRQQTAEAEQRCGSEVLLQSDETVEEGEEYVHPLDIAKRLQTEIKELAESIKEKKEKQDVLMSKVNQIFQAEMNGMGDILEEHSTKKCSQDDGQPQLQKQKRRR